MEGRNVMATATRRGEIGRLAALGVAWMTAGVLGACATASQASPSAGSPRPLVTDPAPSHGSDATPGPTAIVREFDVGGDGWAMAASEGALWIQVDPPVDAIVRIDTATGLSKPAVPLGWRPKAGPEGVWVVCCDWLVRVDPATGHELLRVDMGGAFALADRAVWLFNDSGLYRIDAVTGHVGKPVGPSLSEVCESSKDLVVAFESAWLACKEGKVIRVEIPSGKVTAITTEAGTHTFAIADGSVWVTNYQAGSVSRIDPTSNKVTTITGAGSGVGITSGRGYVWAATATGIAKIDPKTNTIEDLVDLGPGEYYELVWDEGFIWVSTRGNRVLKVEPSM
jgi:hypothetical protein